MGIDNFELFEQLVSSFHKKNNTNCSQCSHKNTVIEHEISICTDCGEELERNINHDREWRYYGKNDNKYTTDPNRVMIRKLDEKSIFADVKTMGFSDSVVYIADDMYNEVTKGQIYRGKSRKALIFACIFHSYRNMGNPQTPESLIKVFKINRKTALKGLKIVNINAPKHVNVYSASFTIEHMIMNIMELFYANKTQVSSALNLYRSIKNKSSKLNRARPKSLSCSIVFYWIQQNNININIKEFSKKVELSELTIQKNIKEIKSILN